MRIAIVDDITSERKALRDSLEIQLSRQLLHADIFEYESGEVFLSAASQNNFSLVFMDIYMKGKNGIETAQKLREFDTKCILVFVTTSTDYALDGFRVRATQYLVKPYTADDLEALLNEVVERLPAPDPYIELHTANGSIQLRLKEILYAEHFQHHVHIHTTNEHTIIVRLTFREFVAGLKDERFFSCNRGSIINLEHAEDFDGKAFLLKNGASIPVSRSLASTAKKSFADFLFQRRRSI